MSINQPLVSVVTPVYNGEKYLVQCIESVLTQSYQNWEYVIVNNASTDGTLEIARAYERRDRRIRVRNNPQMLGLLQNWNYALRQISPESKYCKVVHADDWLFPECLEQMVALGEEAPTIAIISAYRLEEDRVTLDGLPHTSRVIPGREICRATLLGKLYVFGSPTSLLLRSEVIRRRPEFYSLQNFHADTEACYDVLRDSDFGFVHQVLTFTRRHNEAGTSFARRMNSYLAGDLTCLVKYGTFYLSREEHERRLRQVMAHYYHFLARALFQRKGKEFWRYHRVELQKLGYPINHFELGKICVSVLFKHLLHPVASLKGLMSRVRERPVIAA